MDNRNSRGRGSILTAAGGHSDFPRPSSPPPHPSYLKVRRVLSLPNKPPMVLVQVCGMVWGEIVCETRKGGFVLTLITLFLPTVLQSWGVLPP